MNGTDAPGRLGAVLRSLGKPSPLSLGPHGPFVTTTLQHAREVLTNPERFDFPMDVSRRSLGAQRGGGQAAPARSPHAITPPLEPAAVARGTEVFAAELDEATAALAPGEHVDVMRFLRTPVARSTTDAVLPGLDRSERDDVADLVLSWVDSLGPVIASTRNPRRWSRVRRTESSCRQELRLALERSGCRDAAAIATVLAAGTQVPIAAGAWLLVKLAEDPALAQTVRSRPDLSRAVAWETVRLCPPTWITARITADVVQLGETEIPAGMVVMVSPLLLGRLETLAPGSDSGEAPLDRFDPLRWDQEKVRPGSWLPFGAGPHACPGRNLGLTQLTHLADWARGWIMVLDQEVQIDQSRGIFPSPALLQLTKATDISGAGLGAPQQNGPA